MTEQITRACGHVVEFAPQGDQWDDARRAKIRATRCPACGRAKNLEDNAAQAVSRPSGRVKKGSGIKLIPVGTEVTLRLTADGWQGVMSAGGVTVESKTGGAMGIISKLARKWLAANGAKLTGKVKE